MITDAPAFRARLGELAGNELKVWMYIWLHTNGELTAFPGNKTMARESKSNIDTVKVARRGLRDERLNDSRGARGDSALRRHAVNHGGKSPPRHGRLKNSSLGHHGGKNQRW